MSEPEAIGGPELLARMRERGFDFFSGVPCSTFGSLYAAVEALGDGATLAAVREDEAVAAAAGACLAGARPVVLMQNSGLGNALNAIASLSLPYRLGFLLMVSWRGFQGRDAPEHLVLGRAMPELLASVGLALETFAPAHADTQMAAARRHVDAGAIAVVAVREGMIR